MSTREEKERLELLQGTLDLLILRTLVFGPEHGQGIARAIQQTSGDELLVEHGALYPALQRLETRGWISAKWGTSDNNPPPPRIFLADEIGARTPRGRDHQVAAAGRCHRADSRTRKRGELMPCGG